MWPEDPEGARRIVMCESHAGQDVRTYDLDAANGGPFQISSAVWAAYFEANYGWKWETVVRDLDVHMRAARVIYDEAGDWSPWRCS